MTSKGRTLYTKAGAEVLQAMNQAGAERCPFFFALSYDLSEGLFIPNALDLNLQDAGIAFKVGQYASAYHTEEQARPLIVKQYPEEQSRYAERFAVVRSGLEHGDSFLTNLTIRTTIDLSPSASLSSIYQQTEAHYQLLVEGSFVCYSPETFVRIEGNEITTYPMKGTASAEVDQAGETLLSDYKEGCEHSTIVDLMRNDLNRIAERVSVRRFKYLDLLETSRGKIWQMSSEIVGQLESSWHSRLGDIMRELLPAGSISGAPKEATCALISVAEGLSRGYYTGVCGYYDGCRLDSGVLIRFIEQAGDQYFYRSGGGITINSHMEDEYQECLQKIYLPLKSSLRER